MATHHPRVQVTLDPELRAAVDRAGPHVGARSGAALIRELALRGAKVITAEARSRQDAIDYLLEEDIDLSALRRVDDERRERLP